MTGSSEKQRYIFIALSILIMGALVAVMGQLFSLATEEPKDNQSLVAEHDHLKNELAEEAGMYQYSDKNYIFVAPEKADSRARDIEEFYSRRQYPGSPPLIPHEVHSDMKTGSQAQSCLSCHSEGGYVDEWKAFAPVTPHADWVNCRQCHVPQNTRGLFVETQWKSVEPPALGRTAIPGGPPPIPHTLKMRQNCLACHAGPGAVAEIRTSHPERVSCRQCHVPIQTQSLWSPEAEAGQ